MGCLFRQAYPHFVLLGAFRRCHGEIDHDYESSHHGQLYVGIEAEPSQECRVFVIQMLHYSRGYVDVDHVVAATHLCETFLQERRVLGIVGGDNRRRIGEGEVSGLDNVAVVVGEQYGDNEVDLLVRGGVTPLEALGGVVSPVRGITTRTSTGGAPDITWRELTTILIVDDVIPSIRQSLRSRFSKTKNTGQTRGAIRSQVIVELESKLRSEIIDSYGDVTVSVYDEDPTVCLVEFSFAVAHGLNQIYLTAHITI